MINHKCVKCGKIYEDACEELLKGCICGSKLFYFVKSTEKILETKSVIDKNSEILEDQEEEFVYQYDEDNKELIIFDVESVNVVSNGKYTIDIEGLMKSKTDNLVYKYDEGKYSVDIEAGFKKIKKRSTKRKTIININF
jgi:predicted  nucleic acid-binding Zn-ribbon protein